jgi:hypothetical protein
VLKFLVGTFDKADEISVGKPEEKAPRQLIVRGMPLKLMHLSFLGLRAGGCGDAVEFEKGVG